ncbi:multimerin-2a isoform X4 [Nerophis ophidion]|uniref:multimerin-2a isoform X4 n=1 Tax=Nerophis ophidion TaxID=159077 RepID=UPI002ADF7A0F|nr:multimerin-2a isoform X4 [Nerophis ophidion]
MMAVRVLVLVLALLVSARSDVRARDPEVEQREQQEEDWAGAAGVVSATETPLLGEGGNYPARSGNWCAFVQKRVVSMAVACGTEKYTIKSQSPCPSGSPECHLVMYKLSTRPLYKQQQKTFTALLWRCCPGHGGNNCDDTGVSEAEVLPAELPVPHMMALLDGFNRSLALLSQQVGTLARDVAQLKSVQQEQEEEEEEKEERPGAEVLHQMVALQRQMDVHQREVEGRLHSQHAMLHYNISSFKTDVDLKLKRHHKMLQISLQAMNATLAEMKQHQDRDRDQDQDQDQDQPEWPTLAVQPSPAVWEAIKRLDNMVVNNTVKVGGLMEDVEATAGGVQQLKRDMKALGERINQTARTSQVQFMETGLEVEAAKVAVLSQVGELAANVSQQGQRLQEMDVDVDYLYTVLYKHNASGQCDCLRLQDAVATLERGVANVTELANENRLALDEDKQAGTGQLGGASDWEPAVEAVQRGLQQAMESLVSHQTRTRTLDQDLARLGSGLEEAAAEVSRLKEVDRKRTDEMKRLSGSFNSLLKDAIRHSDVLELLLGEEVLEFLEWPLQDQEAHSIPALKEQLRLLQEQLQGHNLSLSRLLGGGQEVPPADEPSPWLASRQHGDAGDLRKMERSVDEPRPKAPQEAPCCPHLAGGAPPAGEEATLHTEVARLKRGLEEHLRTFKSVFSNADVLERSHATLELDQVWRLLGKKKERGGRRRSRRRAGDVHAALSQSHATKDAASPHRASGGVLRADASLDKGNLGSRSGGDVVYAFTLATDMRAPRKPLHQQGAPSRPRTAHLRLRRGEELRLEIRGGERADPGDAVAVLLLRRDT